MIWVKGHLGISHKYALIWESRKMRATDTIFILFLLLHTHIYMYIYTHTHTYHLTIPHYEEIDKLF